MKKNNNIVSNRNKQSKSTHEIVNYSNEAHNQLICNCAVCLRGPIFKEIANHDAMKIPEGQVIQVAERDCYEFVLDGLVNAKINERIKINVPETFFFKNSRVISFYYNNENGELTRSRKFITLKKVETAILSKFQKKQDQDPDLIDNKPVYTCIHEKFQRAKKLKTQVALVRMINGTYRILNQFFLPFQIQKSSNIHYVQLYFKEQPIHISFLLQRQGNSENYKRAQKYAKILKGDIVKWDKEYINKQDEAKFQLLMYKQGINKILQYLGYKIICILNLAKICILDCKFYWIVERETSSVLLSNIQRCKYIKNYKKAGHIQLQHFQKLRQLRIQEKLKKIDDKQILQHYQFKNRVDQYEQIMDTQFQNTKRELMPKYQAPEHQQKSERAFRKLHPEITEALTNILGDQQKFRKTVKSLFKAERGRSIIKIAPPQRRKTQK